MFNINSIAISKHISIKLLSVILVFLFILQVKAQSTQLLGGYTDKLSYVEGQLVTFYTQDNHQEPSHPYVNYGLYNVNNVIQYTMLDFNKTSQLSANFSGAAEGFNYTPTKYWQVPNTLKSGLYYIGDLNNPDPNHIVPFIIRKYDRLNSEIVIVIPTNTQTAYNGAGQHLTSGFGLYHHDQNGIVQPVSFHRPMENQNYFMSFYKPFLQWYYGVGFPNYYSTNVISDADMGDFNEIVNAKLLIIIGHSEYWTREARENFDAFVENGGNALILSGNTMYWPARIKQDPNNPSNTQLVCYKGTGDPNESNSLLDTKFTWNDISNLNYSTLGSIGSDSYRGGFQSTGRIKSGTAEYIYPGFNGHKVIKPLSPLFQNTSLSYGSIINVGTDYGPENDGILISNGDPISNSLPQNAEPLIDLSALGFYRGEIIAYDKIEMLIDGHLSSQPENDIVYAYTPIVVFQKTCTSGKIINVNTNAWCSQSMIGNNSTVQQITSNIIALTYWGYNIFSESAPSSFNIKPSKYSVSYSGCEAINISPCGINSTSDPLYMINSTTKSLSILDGLDCSPQNRNISNNNKFEDFGIFKTTNNLNYSKSKLTIFPNPNDGQFKISFPNNNDNVHIDINDVSGRNIFKGNTIENSYSFDLKKSGIYFIKISSEKGLLLIDKIVVE